jgi:hypothetical protein
MSPPLEAPLLPSDTRPEAHNRDCQRETQPTRAAPDTTGTEYARPTVRDLVVICGLCIIYVIALTIAGIKRAFSWLLRPIEST